MPDQPSPPAKPKVGSLRDRIAAFEKSASAPAPPPGPAPAPRPKPAGFGSWKPKAPSPPSSPSAATAEHAGSSTRAAGMSASDAKESITKAGSLKERMAALQGKGAFGAPPPVAPKPAVEKPKWKPPPVVQAPVDDDDHAGEGSTAMAGVVERTISPPTSNKSHESVEAPKDVAEAEKSAPAPATSAEGDNEGEADPEEEERQRRAAIAARMARLGGARLGMAPPVFGKKPPLRRPTQEGLPKAEEPKQAEEQPNREVVSPESVKPADETASPDEGFVSSPPTETPVHVQSEVREPSEYFPARKSSENASILSSESTESQHAKGPSSMPVPAVPRRAGPPRKKPVKPAAPALGVPEETVEEVPSASAIIDKIFEEPESGAPKPVQEISSSPEHVESKPETTEEAPPVVPTEAHDTTVEPASEQEIAISDEVGSPESRSLSPPTLTSSSEVSLTKEIPGTLSPPPSLATGEDESENDKEELDDEPEISAETASPPAEVAAVKEIEPQTEAVTAAADEDEDEDDNEAAEEEARKKRVAEPLATMGGVSPFAPPAAQAKASPETTHTHSLSTGSVSSPPVAAVGPRSPSPEPIQSARKEGLIESKAEDDDSDEYEAEDNVFDDESEPASKSEQHEKPKAATVPHFEHVGSASHPPPPVPSNRPYVQVQQYGREDDDFDDDSAPRSIPVPSSPPAHEAAVSLQAADHSQVSLPPARPAQQPRRIIPQPPEDDEEEEGQTDDEADERLAQSQLFVPPPTGRGLNAVLPLRRHHQDEDEDSDGDGSENDTPALPVPHRKSLEVPPGRAVPQAPLSDEEEEEDAPESDHDGKALPIPPRRTSGPPLRIVPPPPHALNEPARAYPSPIRRSLPPAPAPLGKPDVDLSPTSSLLTPSVSVSGSEEILDEEEGDPIDPSFHSPSRRSSFVAQSQDEALALAPAHSPPPLRSLPPVHSPLPIHLPPPVHSPPPIHSPPAHPPPPPPSAVPPPPPVEQAEELEQGAEQLRRNTIAERMAKLGGIKFGAAPLPTPPPPHHEEDQQEVSTALAEEEQAIELSEEEEERARKERIAAKLSHMGGMRIGMMPMGTGGLPPQRSHVLREEDVVGSPTSMTHGPPPIRAVPPSRPPPPHTQPRSLPQVPDTDSEHGTDDGVKIEAEESEIEEVNYEDAEPEEAPPPVPSRDSRPPHRQESIEKPTSARPPRPPVPVAISTRRSSVLTTKSTGSTSEAVASPTKHTRSSFLPQSEYVMVEEPESQETPPSPPARRTSRVPPPRSTPQVPQPARMGSDPKDSISSQWELPSIPTSSLEFDGGPDLSLSWTDAGEPMSESASSQAHPHPPGKQPAAQPKGLSHKSMSADDLIALWGRVGVQVCDVATTLFEKSKKTLIGDGTYAGFVKVVLDGVPNAARLAVESGEYGYLIYVQNGAAVQKRVSEIMPGDIVEIHDAKLKGHKGIHVYHQNVGDAGEVLVGIVGEYEAKKSKIRVFHANQHVGQQTVESVSYRLEDLKSGIVKVYRVLEA